MNRKLTSLISDNCFVSLPGFGLQNLYLKLENLNPAGSIKFKTALGLINSCEDAGIMKDDTVLIESSSGNLGVALSVICAERGYQFSCVVDPNTNEQNIKHMKALGSNVVCISKKDGNGGFLGTRLDYIRDLVRRDERYYWLNQYENPANPGIHMETTARAIDSAFKRLDYLFVGVGTAGTLMGCARHFAQARPSTKIVAVDSIGSVAFGLPAGKRYVPGLGSSQAPKLLCSTTLHALMAVPEAAAVSTCRYLARVRGILVGGSTGTVLSAVRASRARFDSSDVVVAISPDGGGPYLGTIFNDEWVRDHFGAEALEPTLNSSAMDQCITINPQVTANKEIQHARVAGDSWSRRS